jgi:hypothetical protein
MIFRNTQVYPINPAAGGTLTLPKENEAYRLYSVAANYTVTNAPQQPRLFILDGGGNTIHRFDGYGNAIGVSGLAQWVAGDWQVDMVNLAVAVGAGTPPGDYIIGIPADLWIQPQWSVVLAQTVWAIGDVFGPFVATTDRLVREKKSVARRGPQPQATGP